MSCNFYVHNDPTGGSKYISGTTCSGTQAYYTLTLGQSVCMNSDLPLINECGLVMSGACLAVTPTPSTTPYNYCYFSALTFNTVEYACADGTIVYNVYGVLRFFSGLEGNGTSDHPALSFIVSNGTDFETVVIEPGEISTEFVFPRVIYNACGTSDCQPTIYPDWFIYTPAVTNCPITPTPTRTPTNTPTQTQTPTNTATSTSTPTQTPTNTTTNTPTNTATQTRTPTQTTTNTATPTNTASQTVTPTNTPSPTATPPIPQFNVCESSDSPPLDNGIYVRATTASGSTFSFGYFNATKFAPALALIEGYYNLGVAPDGKYYPIYQVDNFGNWNTWSRLFTGSTDYGWAVLEQFQNPLDSGSTVIGGTIWGNYTQQTNGSAIYPINGNQSFSGYGSTFFTTTAFLTYDLICPTPTASPTPTNTITPTVTPTNTPTQTVTPTKTNTPTPSRVVYAYSTTLTGYNSVIDACASGKTCQQILYSADNPLTSGPVRSKMYTDSGLTTLFDGAGNRWALNLNCAGTWRAAQITTIGEIFSITNC